MLATYLTLRLAELDLQYVIFCDSSSDGTGFVLMIQDYPNDRNGKRNNSYATLPFLLSLLSGVRLEFCVYLDFLALYFAVDRLSHFLWEGTELVVV